MSKIVAIANDNTALQLSLTGINVEKVTNPKEAGELIIELLDSDAEMLIIQEEIRDGLPEFHANLLARHKGAPLVVYCPSFSEEESDVDAYLSSIIKPAVGYEIRLE